MEQLAAPVRFTHAGQALIKEGVQTFVEVGPGNVLSGLIKRIDRQREDDLGLDRRKRSTSSRRRFSLPDAFASLEGKTALVTGGRGVSGVRSRSSLRAPVRGRTLSYRSGKERRRGRRGAGARAVEARRRRPGTGEGTGRGAGELDILVNNAGVTRDGLIARCPTRTGAS